MSLPAYKTELDISINLTIYNTYYFPRSTNREFQLRNLSGDTEEAQTEQARRIMDEVAIETISMQRTVMSTLRAASGLHPKLSPTKFPANHVWPVNPLITPTTCTSSGLDAPTSTKLASRTTRKPDWIACKPLIPINSNCCTSSKPIMPALPKKSCIACYIPTGSQGEKGVDVALAVNATEVGLDGKMDVAALITGDGDFVPLVRTLMKHGIRVACIYFHYEHDHNGKKYEAFANNRLLDACNYSLNINSLEKDREFHVLFKGLFRQPEQPSPQPALIRD